MSLKNNYLISVKLIVDLIIFFSVGAAGGGDDYDDFVDDPEEPADNFLEVGVNLKYLNIQ